MRIVKRENPKTGGAELVKEMILGEREKKGRGGELECEFGEEEKKRRGKVVLPPIKNIGSLSSGSISDMKVSQAVNLTKMSRQSAGDG